MSLVAVKAYIKTRVDIESLGKCKPFSLMKLWRNIFVTKWNLFKVMQLWALAQNTMVLLRPIRPFIYFSRVASLLLLWYQETVNSCLYLPVHPKIILHSFALTSLCCFVGTWICSWASKTSQLARAQHYSSSPATFHKSRFGCVWVPMLRNGPRPPYKYVCYLCRLFSL